MNGAVNKIWRPVVRPILWVHHRLLPSDSQFGWTPYLWLPYLTFFFLSYTGKPFGVLRWTIYAVAGLAFVILYFRAYQAMHRGATAELGWIITVMTLMGCGFMWPDGNSLVFFIYAATLCGGLGSFKKGMWALLLVIVACLISALAVKMDLEILTYILFFMVVLGLANIYFGEMARKNRVLKQSQEEIRRLAATAERERIARDLHDLLGHTLTLITVKAELAAKLAERDMPGAAREIREVEHISREALQQVREAVGGYRNGGLAGEVINARIALGAANIALSECAVTTELPARQDALLALVLREAVTNVVRHSDARTCVIRVEATDGQARLYVQDDGRGGCVQEGNGIRGMRERLRALDGELTIQSILTGTRLSATVPLARQSPEPAAGWVPA